MQATYEKAITQVFEDEGGYTDNRADRGGPTNWGITLHDAQTYWKHGATAEDVKAMPKSVAEDIYVRHYADPINYNSLPPGVDYAVLDYAVNSGVTRALNVYSEFMHMNPVDCINAIYDERLKFLEGLSNWKDFGHGWTNRCVHGKSFAISLNDQYKTSDPPSIFTSIINFFFPKKGQP